MAENSPQRRSRVHPSPRKLPYPKNKGLGTTGVAGLGASNSNRSPLRDIQANIRNQFNQKQQRQGSSKPNHGEGSRGQVAVFNENFNFSFANGTSSLFPSNKPKTIQIATEAENMVQRQNKRNEANRADGNKPAPKPLQNAAASTSSSPKLIENCVPLEAPKKNFGVIGENRKTSSSSQCFIPLDKSCVMRGNEIHASDTSFSDLETSGSEWSGGSVTRGILGQLQPRGLNTSFTEKFESRLGLNSRPLGGEAISKSSGILTERFIPLYDFPDYYEDILRFWESIERKYRIKHDYMKNHYHITHKMRSILVDWIADVSIEYEMSEESLHLAVNYLDRFLNVLSVDRNKLQLVGTACLFIAAKFEEISPPHTSDYAHVTDDAYTKEEILKMERVVLNTLNYNLMVPTVHDFALAYCSILKQSDPIKCLTMYLCDLSLIDGEAFLRFLPSVISGAALTLSRFVFEGIYWEPDLAELCPHRLSSINYCVQLLHKEFHDASENQNCPSIYEKYQAVQYCCVSQMIIPEMGPWKNRDKTA